MAFDESKFDTAALHADGLHAIGDAERAYRVRLWHRRNGDRARTIRLSHEYRAYEMAFSAPRAPQSNGHLHRLAVAYRFDGRHWQFSAAPVLAGSSNAARHPKVIDAEFVFWQGSARYRRAWSPAINAFGGVCRDDRFGKARLAPVLGMNWRVNDTLELTLGYPDTHLSWRFRPRWLVRADIHPAGGRWRVYDEPLVRRSLFSMKSWRLRLGLALRVTRAHELGFGVGREIRREFAFRLGDGTELRTDAADATFTGIRWRWTR